MKSTLIKTLVLACATVALHTSCDYLNDVSTRYKAMKEREEAGWKEIEANWNRPFFEKYPTPQDRAWMMSMPR